MEPSENYLTILQNINNSIKSFNITVCQDCNKYLCRNRLLAYKRPVFISCKFFNNSVFDPDF